MTQMIQLTSNNLVITQRLNDILSKRLKYIEQHFKVVAPAGLTQTQWSEAVFYVFYMT